MTWQDKAENAPPSPGVYIMRDGQGKPLYVGKAKNIRKRTMSYRDAGKQGPKNRLLLRHVRDIEFVVTDTEVEALILENSLIKKWRPRYNISLRDDKTYPLLRLSVQEDYPTLNVVRRSREDGARYFGPYVPAGAMRKTIALLQDIFPLRRCRGPLVSRKRPCLNFQMRKCLGPCTGQVAMDTYHEMVRGVALFLRGKGKELSGELRRKMRVAAGEMRYEEAGDLRDMALAIEATLEPQKAHLAQRGDMDVFGGAVKGSITALAVLQVRQGKILGSKSYRIEERRGEEHPEETMAEFLRAYYGSICAVPPLVLLPAAVDGRKALEEWMGAARGAAVKIKVPVRGELRSLVAMAVRNAQNAVERGGPSREAGMKALAGVAARAGSRHDVKSLVAVDVSNIAGTDAAASMIWFEGGAFKPGHYRRMRIKAARGGDDYGALQEALTRFVARVRGGRWRGPDALLVDGGRGQLRSARLATAGEGWRPSLLLAIAKPGEGESTDKIFTAGRRDPLRLGARSAELRLLQRVRDEAHRFALEYHRKLRGQKTRRSVIDQVPGVGPARKKLLLSHFGSLGRIKEAAREDLLRVRGLPEGVAMSLYEALRREDDAREGH